MLVDSTEDIKKLSVEKHLKRLEELSLKSIGEIPQLHEPNYEQKQFIKEKRFHK